MIKKNRSRERVIKKELAKNEVSAGIVVFFQNPDKKREYLILHYEEGHFDLPKGHVENNEKLEETAFRETFEETGLKINIIDGFKEKISYFFKDRYNNFRLVKKDVYFFVGKSETKEVRLSKEHIGYEWLSLKDALEKVTYKDTENIIKKVDDFLNKI